MILVTGTYPPERCGVADYSARLLESKSAQDAGWKLLHTTDVRMSAVFKVIKEIKRLNDNEINIQYPSRGYINSILPHLLCIYLRLFTRKKISTTIHEYTQLGWKGRLASNIFLVCSHKLFFTNPFERDAAIRAVKSVAKKNAIIKIYSNIPTSKNIKPLSERIYDVGYFGYIRPEKGIEEFIQVLGQVKQEKPDVKAYILGQTLPDLQDYAKQIFAAAEKAGVELLGSKPDDETADVLADTKIGYLPLPDGLSERRGSFLAYVKNKAIIVANDGPFVSDYLRSYFQIVSSSDEGRIKLIEILSASDKIQEAEQENVIAYAEKELPASWDDVVKSYLKELEK